MLSSSSHSCKFIDKGPGRNPTESHSTLSLGRRENKQRVVMFSIIPFHRFLLRMYYVQSTVLAHNIMADQTGMIPAPVELTVNL